MENIKIENIFPTGKRLLMEAHDHAEETSEGLIQVNENTNTAPVIGTVVRTGEDSQYEIGTVLMWRRYALDTLTIPTSEGESKYHLLEENEVVAVVKVGEVAPPNAYRAIEKKKALENNK